MRRKIKFWRYLIVGQVLAAIGANRLAEWILGRAMTAAVERDDSGGIAAVYSVQAFLEERKSDKRHALALLKKAVEVAPDDEKDSYYCELGMLYKAQGDYPAAVLNLTEALRLLESDASQEYRTRLEAELRECREKARDSGNAPGT